MIMKSNFKFMEAYWPEMAQLGETAEAYLHTDPNACIFKLGLLSERLILEMLKYESIAVPDEATHAERIQIAKRNDLIPQSIDNILYALRKGRNDAVHKALNSFERAATLLRMTHRLCTWFMEVYGDWSYEPEEYSEPDSSTPESDLLARIREQETKLEELAERIEAIPTAASQADTSHRHERAEKAAENIRLTEEETNYLSGEQIRIEVSGLSVINFALQQNGMPAIRSVQIDNNTSDDIFDAEIQITSTPDFCRPYRKSIDLISAKSRFGLKNISLAMDAAYLAGLTERVAGTLTVELLHDGQALCSETVDVSVLAFNEWHGYGIYPELLASFVTPNHPAIQMIISRAAGFLEEWTKDPSLDGYQSKDNNRVLMQAAAVFKALQEQNIVYAEPPASFEATGQRVRLCDEVLSQKMGTCLDLSLLYAGCLEAIGLYPLLIIQRGHIFAGLWLEESTFSECVQDDVSLLTKRLAEGSRVLSVVECTLFTAGRNTKFDEACKAAEYLLMSKDGIECFIDIRRTRLSHISPLPVRVLKEDGWHVERPELDADSLTSAPEYVAAALEISDRNDQEFSKKVLWERKLLDLGMRNTLLNMRLTKTMVPLLSSSLDDLEDALTDGGDFSIGPRPTDWYPAGGKVGFESLHIVEGYQELLRSEFKNGRIRSALTESELSNSLKNLYRSARTDMEENGANTLYLALGLLKWYETERSTQPRYAPLLLVPIEMVRKSVASGYVIRLRDDEAQINITMLEKLRQDFSIEINGLDPLPMDSKGIDTRRVFATVRHDIMNQKRWDVLESACLGIFSFSRFVMWNDIHNRADDLARNKVVRSLMENQLTWQAEDMETEDQVPEDQVLLPISADASQLFAIQSAGEGKSFVLHGPPGTGKSQTITALIAHVLSQGKTVLFVAEKMAALEVVQKRLSAIGLAPFCLELHSNKAKKKDVLEQLRFASEVTKYRSSGEYAALADRIEGLRKELNSYASALHRQQTCGESLFALINEYQAYQSAADIHGFTSDFFKTVTAAKLFDMNTLVDNLVAAGRAVGHPHGHPLTPVGCKSFSQQLRREATENADEYRQTLNILDNSIRSFAGAINTSVPFGFNDIGQLVINAQCLVSFEYYPESWIRMENPDEYLSRVQVLSQHELNSAAYKAKLYERWNDSFLQADGNALLASYDSISAKWFLGKIFGMNKFRKQLLPMSKGIIQDQFLRQDFVDLAAYQQERKEADLLLSELSYGLGAMYKGEGTDWKQISDLARSALDTIRNSRRLAGADRLRVTYGCDRNALQLAHRLSDAWSAMFQAKRKLLTLLEIKADNSTNWIASQNELCNCISSHAQYLREWVLWNRVCDDAEKAGLYPVVKAYREGLEHDMVVPAYKKAIYKGLAVEAIESDKALNEFTGTDFNEKIAQFRRLDQEMLNLAKSEIYCKLAAQVPSFTQASVGSSETGILQRAIKSGGRGTSIRKLFEQIPNLLQKLCPCMLMSPISVAQYLDPNRKPFDLVVFDEASQLPTSKAIGALARGENAVIVGDPKQMPPTSFFASNTTDEDHLDAEDMESILDDCLALNMPQTHLLWHYRSRHESLIAFSNIRFYENKLYTFPSVNDRESRVHLVHVDGVFERGGKRINRAEAEAVVSELKRRCHDPECSGLSVGVVTFNISQQNLIDDLLTEACKDDPQLEEWAYNSKEPVFIKNLENVQGDERDVILFSVGYGPDRDGRVSMNFGPLNRDGGWRRLNVAVSRARYEMIVYATLTPDQINLSRTSAEGVAALKEFMEFAAGDRLSETENTASAEKEITAGIVRSICDVLHDHGYETDQLIGDSAYKIDIGVIDPKDPEKYLLGILLDGAGYKNAKTTRDREIAQINVLEGLGWHIIRIWTMDWWDNSSREIERVLNSLKTIEEEEAQKADSTVIPDTIPETETANEQENTIPSDSDSKLRGVVSPVPIAEKHPTEQYQITRLPITNISADRFVDPSYGNSRLVRERVLKVLEQESPICESLLTRRVVQSFSIARAGSRIQNYMNEVYRSLNLKYTVYGETKYYWKASHNPSTYTGFRVSSEGENKRDAADIPVQEAANAVCRALELNFSLSEDDLIRAAANLMGISRIGPSVNTLFTRSVLWAEKAKRIFKSDNGNWMLAE